MTRAQTLIVTTALAAVLPLASAMAQTGGNPGTKCGAETWSAGTSSAESGTPHVVTSTGSDFAAGSAPFGS